MGGLNREGVLVSYQMNKNRLYKHESRALTKLRAKYGAVQNESAKTLPRVTDPLPQEMTKWPKESDEHSPVITSKQITDALDDNAENKSTEDRSEDDSKSDTKVIEREGMKKNMKKSGRHMNVNTQESGKRHKNNFV